MSSTLKEFLMTLAATTVSIVLTFGTTAIIDRKKQKAEKREMVMMIMYDMHETLQAVGQCDDDLKAFFDNQVDIVAHPQKFQEAFILLGTHYPSFEYTTTTENIFRSNIETIQTIGNILFVETVSSFYDNRERYKKLVVEDFQKQADSSLSSYENLRDFDTSKFPFFSESFIRSMSTGFEQCKLMMKVSDKELEAFSIQQRKLWDATKGDVANDVAAASSESQQRHSKLLQAREQGKKALAQ